MKKDYSYCLYTTDGKLLCDNNKNIEHFGCPSIHGPGYDIVGWNKNDRCGSYGHGRYALSGDCKEKCCQKQRNWWGDDTDAIKARGCGDTLICFPSGSLKYDGHIGVNDKCGSTDGKGPNGKDCKDNCCQRQIDYWRDDTDAIKARGCEKKASYAPDWAARAAAEKKRQDEVALRQKSADDSEKLALKIKSGCPEYDEYPATAIGTDGSKSCGPGYSSYSHKYCNITAEWDTTEDKSDCLDEDNKNKHEKEKTTNVKKTYDNDYDELNLEIIRREKKAAEDLAKYNAGCPENDGYSHTLPGARAKKPCEEGSDANIERLCDALSQWGVEDRGDCELKKFLTSTSIVADNGTLTDSSDKLWGIDNNTWIIILVTTSMILVLVGVFLS